VSSGFLLDTNVPSELTKPLPEPREVAWVACHDDLHLSVVSIGEVRRGFALLPQGKRRAYLEEWFENFLVPLGGQENPSSNAIDC
jgi:predicted nucleic acid-binding protein